MSRLPARPSVVALRAAGLGDLLTAVPALRALAAAFPDHACAVAAPRWLEPVVAAVDPPIGLVPHEGLGPIARAAPPARAVNLHGCGPQSHRVLLATGAKRLLAFAHREVPESRTGPPWRDDEHETARWCRLLEWYGVCADPASVGLRDPGPPPPGLAGTVVVHPGAASAARRWPPARWAAVTAHLVRTGHRVVITGTGPEAALVSEVARESGVGSAVRAHTDLPLQRLMQVVAKARLVCSADTGVAHLAFAYRIPSVTIYGPTPPSRWGPPPGGRAHTALWAGRTGDPHAPAADPGLLEIAVGDVLGAIDALVAASVS